MQSYNYLNDYDKMSDEELTMFYANETFRSL